MVRDIIAFDKASPTIWGNFQCKHHKAGLTLGDIWLELGKLVWTAVGGTAVIDTAALTGCNQPIAASNFWFNGRSNRRSTEAGG